MKKFFFSSFIMMVLLLGVNLNAQTVVQTWGFETSLENWGSGDGAASVALSNEQAASGSQSAKLVGAADHLQINFQNDSFEDVQQGDIIQYKVWISAADLVGVNGMSIFFQDGSGWAWHDQWISTSTITGDQWNTCEYTFPAIASPLQRIGFQVNDLAGQEASTPTIYVDDITLTRPAVPVELVSFAASVSGNSVTLTWKTATELNNSGFEIQRSIDNNEFVSVGFVKGSGTTTESHSYSYADNISGKFFYRLKQVDFNGTFEYSDVVEASTQPTEFSLEQNYPNPFNPTTTISFNLPEKSDIHLLLVDVLGNTVKELASGTFEPGSHKIKLDASNFGSGVYFYRLEAGNFVNVKKLVLMK